MTLYDGLQLIYLNSDFTNIYGGDEFSQKAASHELNGLKVYYEWITLNTGNNLNVPLMVNVISFRSFLTLIIIKRH